VTRVEPRVSAFQALYAADAVDTEAPETSELGSRARDLTEGTLEHLADLDREIAGAARGWRLERMPAVDRTILRLALYELRHTDTPVGVVISEAVEIAKVHSTARSGGFVNGILGELAKGASAEGASATEASATERDGDQE
jgi:N utilization substance protein B